MKYFLWTLATFGVVIFGIIGVFAAQSYFGIQMLKQNAEDVQNTPSGIPAGLRLNPTLDAATIKVGDHIAGFKVVTIRPLRDNQPLDPQNIRIEFEGPLTVRGTYAIYDIDGPTLKLDEDLVGTLPTAAAYPVRTLCFANSEGIPSSIQPGDRVEMILGMFVFAYYPTEGCIAPQTFTSIKEL